MNNLKKDINRASYLLKKGGVIIFPTDTVYGIGTLPEKESMAKLYRIKKRDSSKKIIALVNSIDTLYGIIDETEENMLKIAKVLEKYWPGELTIIFKADVEFTGKFDTDMDTIGVRIPRNRTALDIIEGSGGIVLTTSANISGEEPVKNPEDIDKRLVNQVDAVIEDDSVLTGVPSTIVKYEEGRMTLLREGNIKLEEIEKLMKG